MADGRSYGAVTAENNAGGLVGSITGGGGLIASLACFILWNLVMFKLGNVTSTNYVYLNPIFTLVTAMVLLGERMTLVSGLGCAAILAGVVLSGFKPSRAYRRAVSFLSPSGNNGRSKKASGSEGCH